MFFFANEVLKIISLIKQCNAGVILNCAGRLAIGKGAKMLTPTTFMLAVHAQTAFPLHNFP